MIARLGLVVCALIAAPAAAEPEPPPYGEARAGVGLFVEPVASSPIVVVSPQVAARADATRWLEVSASWDADIVTGATPRIYGQPDAVTAATPFTDARHTLAAALAGTVGPARLDVGYSYGFENDYRAHTLSADVRADLFHKNTTLRAAYAHGFDSACDLDNGALPTTLRQPLGTSAGCFAGTRGLTEEPLAIDQLEVGWAQVLTARLVGELVGSWERLDGFQSNPYRRVRLEGGTEAQESHPRLRDRGSIAARLRLAIPKARAAAALDLRIYRDTWGIESITVELDWEQRLPRELWLKLRARYYQQSGAVFYRDAGQGDSYEAAGPAGAYFTGDREMAPLADLLIGARLAWQRDAPPGRRMGRIFRSLEAALRVDLIDVFALTPLPPDVDRTRGVVDALTASLALTGRF